MTGFVALGVLSTAAWFLVALALFRTQRALGSLCDEPAERAAWPRLSVIVPACDEAATVGAALRSLLAQDYPALEVVAIDDRSRDDTGRILDRLAEADPRLRVLHVRELPAGWLGKNHACDQGARAATGDWLLFTDADVHFGHAALRRAIAAAQRLGLHHLVAFPHLIAPGLWERAFVCTFALFACLKFRVWQLPHAGTPAFVGVGAFSLVRRDAYLAIGGHSRLAFEVVDDAKLGLLLRRGGFAQGALDSNGLVRVRWQDGFVASLRGLVKNAFAAVEYRWAPIGAAAVFVTLLLAGPWALALWAPAPALRWLGVALIGASTAGHGAICRRAAFGHGFEGLLLPFTMPALVAVLLWSAIRASLQDGIHWRGTHYALADLRRGCVREDDYPVARAVGWPSAAVDGRGTRPGTDRARLGS